MNKANKTSVIILMTFQTPNGRSTFSFSMLKNASVDNFVNEF